MPNMDGTGPKGEGPKTGRRQGKCVDSINSAENNEICPGNDLGRGGKNCAHRGLGLGHGCRN